jgi:hypothetical protein
MNMKNQFDKQEQQILADALNDECKSFLPSVRGNHEPGAARPDFLFLALVAGLMMANFAFSAALKQPTPGKPPAAEAWDAQTTPLQRLTSHYTPAQLENGVYVGSEFCIGCHQEYKTWKDTKHALSIRKPMTRYSLIPGKGVVADYDHNGVDDFIQGLDFNKITSVFDAYKPYAPVLSVEKDQYFITMGKVKLPVIFVLGGTGDWRERYGVRLPVSDSPTGYSDEIYTSPVQFNEDSKTYFAYKIGNWYGPTKRPLVTPGTTRASISESVKQATFSKNCIGCHLTGIRSIGKTDQGEWLLRPYPAFNFEADNPAYFDYDGDGKPDLMNIGCEMCHGPGSAHVLDRKNPAKIVNPANLNTDQANEVCGRCHNRVRSAPNKTYGFAYHDDTDTEWRPGKEPLANYTIDNNSYWPDGETSYEHNQHYSEMRRSGHATLRCSDCHDPHAQVNAPQIVTQRTEGNLVIPTRFENNTLCLSCHAGKGPFQKISKPMIAKYADNIAVIGAAVSAHSHHPYAPERAMGLSRCTGCHMPAIAAAEHESPLHTHHVKVVPPEKTLQYQAKGGMPNACAASCHGDKVNLWGYGMKEKPVIWNEPTDVKTATRLMEYYGPEGKWWRTGVKKPVDKAASQ